MKRALTSIFKRFMIYYKHSNYIINQLQSLISNHKRATDRDLHDGHLAVLPEDVIQGGRTEGVHVVRHRRVHVHPLLHLVAKRPLPSLQHLGRLFL